MPILKVAIGKQALRFCYGTQFLIRLLTVVSINFNAVEFLYLLQWTQCYTIKGKTYIQKGKKLSENHRLAGASRALCVPLCPSGPPPLQQGTQSRVPSATARQLLEIPREETPQPLWPHAISSASHRKTLLKDRNFLCSLKSMYFSAAVFCTKNNVWEF